MENFKEKSMKELKFYGWCLTQDRLHLGDIEARSRDPEHVAIIQKHIAEIDEELDAVRAEIKNRKGGGT